MERVILGSRELYLNVSTSYSLASFLPPVPPCMFLRTGSHFVLRAVYTGLKLAVILLLLPPKLLGVQVCATVPNLYLFKIMLAHTHARVHMRKLEQLGDCVVPGMGQKLAVLHLIK